MDHYLNTRRQPTALTTTLGPHDPPNAATINMFGSHYICCYPNHEGTPRWHTHPHDPRPFADRCLTAHHWTLIC